MELSGTVLWGDDFEPVAELTHDYGSQAVHYGPENPAPRWSSQLAALEMVARRATSELGAERIRGLESGRIVPMLVRRGQGALFLPIRIP